MEFKGRNSNDFLQEYRNSLSSSPVEKHSTNGIHSVQPRIPKEPHPNPPEIFDSYISTLTNNESPSVSCILPADEPSETSLYADRFTSLYAKDQLSFPTISEKSNNQTTTQPDFTSPEMGKNSKLELQHPDLNVSIILDFLKLHEEKYNFLQEQMTRLLEQKAMPCYPNPKAALVPTNDNKSNGNLISSQFSLDDVKIGVLDKDTESSKLLACLQAQREKSLKLEVLNQTLQERIQILQEENRKLQNRNDELINFLLNANGNSFSKIDNAHSPNSIDTDPLFNNVAGSVSFEERKKLCTNNIDVQQETAKTISSGTKASSSDVANIEVRQEKEVEKTSTSTMTSVIYDGSDKVVYKKLTTVTTDFKKQCNEISAHCSMNREAENTPQHRPSPKCTTSNSQKKRLKCRKCGKCSPHSGGRNKTAHNVSSDTLENECGKNGIASSPCGMDTVCGVLGNTGKKNEIHNTEPKRIVSSKYEKILRNVNKLVLNFEEDEAVLRKLKGCKNTPSRTVDSMSIARKSVQRHSDQRRSSNSSTESINTSPENSVQEAPLKEVYGNETASTTISMYGLSSNYLSKATRDYLDNFGLVRDHSRTLKYQTTLPKRYPR